MRAYEGEGEEEEGDEFGGEADGEALAHIGGGERTAVAADVWLVEIFAEVIVGTAETAVEDAGEGCLWPSAVGRGVLIGVAEGEAEVVEELRRVAHRTGEDHEEGCEAGWDVVGDIVDMRCPAAEVLVAGCLVAYHRIEGVDELIGEHAGGTEEHIPEHRSHDTVAEVLGEGLKGCRAHLLGIELRSVTTYDACHLTATVGDAAVNGLEDHAHLLAEGVTGEAEEHHNGIDGDVGYGVRPQQMDGECHGSKEQADAHDHEGGTLCLAVGGFVKVLLAHGNPLAHIDDRVGQARGIAEEEVEEPAYEEG